MKCLGTNNIRWDSFEHFANNPKVKWAIPMSLGDSHRGYRVMGTSEAYFEHYQYGHKQNLKLASGRAFASDPFEVVLGAEVADALHYKLGDKLVLAHGVAVISLVKHDDKPFTVVGILARTGTPVDRTLHISLGGMEAIHIDWHNGVPAHGAGRISADQARNMDLTPQAITAFMLGLNSKISTFALQREINDFRGEPMMAILPGVALQELWSLMSTAEKALFVVSLHIATLLIFEALALALAGVIAGVGLLYVCIAVAQGYVQSNYGLYLPLAWPSEYEWTLLGGILAAALLMGCVPAWRAYRQSLADGLSIRL